MQKPKDIGNSTSRKDILPVNIDDHSNEPKDSSDGVKTVNPTGGSVNNGTKVPMEGCAKVGMGLSNARDGRMSDNCENQFMMSQNNTGSSNNVYSGN